MTGCCRELRDKYDDEGLIQALITFGGSSLMLDELSGLQLGKCLLQFGL